MRKTEYPNVFESNRKLFTANFAPGAKVYFENLVAENGIEYREWNPKRSKLCSGFTKGINLKEIKEDSKILYLGAASGTTVSHISDICTKGKIFAVEFSPEVFMDLFFLSQKRKNIFPILGDANQPNQYYHRLQACDVVYQDIAQRNQVDIFEKNCALFLKNQGTGILCVKSRSIDVTKQPRMIYNEVREQLKKRFKIIDEKELFPFQKDHIMFIIKGC